MNELRQRLRGLWLPLVTPFRDGAIDELSLRRLVRHYASGPIDGLILAATSGEGLLLATDELEHLVAAVRSGGSGARHHETGDGCRHDERLPCGMACHRSTPIARNSLTPSSLVHRDASNRSGG